MSDESLPRPPRTFEDREGRDITIRALADDPTELEALVAMYDDFDPADRAQGIPPVGESAVCDWLDTLLDGESYNLVAWHGDEAVGHATLVADGDRGYELAIFVYQPYQGAGIGTRLLRTLLGHGEANGVETVWLTVERWNRPAIALYEKVGFETKSSESFELEMERSLD
ncbi:MAG: N-acetyltransferase family protein [Halobacteriaceae archaeon]